uniref:site-2 protease family protein n=1 Tax=uncultured Ruthenibacterium sp. TaxID=1905347 RepID=UPI00349EDA30
MASWLLTALASIFVFGLVIFIHELGHFLTAKFSGITVQEFAIGMGPTLFRFQRKET